MMKKCLIVFALVAMALSAAAQSAYQKKMTQIFEKYYVKTCNGGRGLSASDKLEFDLLVSSEEGQGLMALSIMGCAMKSFSEAEAKRLIDQMSNEIEAAKKLKTPEEIAEEKRQKEEKERQKELERFYESDLGKVVNNVSEAMTQWAKQGEFEKKEAFLRRLEQRSAAVFDSLCASEIHRRLDNYRRLSLGSYNADAEEFLMEYECNGRTFLPSVKVPFDQSQQFKKTLRNGASLSHTDLIYSKSYKRAGINWGVEDNTFVPLPGAYPMQKDGLEWTIVFDTNSAVSDIEISGAITGLPQLASYTFNYRTWLAGEKVVQELLPTYNERLKALFEQEKKRMSQTRWGEWMVNNTFRYRTVELKSSYRNEAEIQRAYEQAAEQLRQEFAQMEQKVQVLNYMEMKNAQLKQLSSEKRDQLDAEKELLVEGRYSRVETYLKCGEISKDAATTQAVIDSLYQIEVQLIETQYAERHQRIQQEMQKEDADLLAELQRNYPDMEKVTLKKDASLQLTLRRYAKNEHITSLYDYLVDHNKKLSKQYAKQQDLTKKAFLLLLVGE